MKFVPRRKEAPRQRRKDEVSRMYILVLQRPDPNFSMRVRRGMMMLKIMRGMGRKETRA